MQLLRNSYRKRGFFWQNLKEGHTTGHHKDALKIYFTHLNYKFCSKQTAQY